MTIFSKSDGFEFVARLTRAADRWNLECFLREPLDPDAPERARHVEPVYETPASTGYEVCRKLAREVADVQGDEASEISWENITD